MIIEMLSLVDPQDTRIARFLFDRIGTSVQTFINDGSSTMIGIIGPVAVSLLTIFVLLWGVAMASGQISEPFTDGMKRIIRMCIIVGFALTVGIYQGTVVDLFKEAPMELASQMTMPGGQAVDDADSMALLLDNTLAKGFLVAKKPWDLGTQADEESTFGISGDGIGFHLLSIMLYIIVVIIVAVAAGLVFVAYMALAILLAIGPLFIMMAIFPATQRWFESWLGQVVNYGLMFLLVALACGLLFAMLDSYFSDLSIQSLDETLMVTLKAVGLSIAMMGVLLQMNAVAGALGGGAAIQASNMAGKLAGIGFATAAAGRTGIMSGLALRAGLKGKSFDRHKSDSERLGGAVRTGMEMARRRFTGSNTAAKG